MKKIMLIVMTVLLTFMITRAQQPLVREWTSYHNGLLNGLDHSNSIVTDAIGNVYVTGQSFQNSSNGSITTVMYDANGNMVWTDNYKGNLSYARNSGEDICLDPFGNVLVTATVATNDGDLSIIKFNEYGRVWATNKEPWWNASYEDFAKEIATDNLGNIYCVASIMSIGGNLQDLFTIKCDSAGNTIWSVVYTSASGADWAEGLSVTPDGHCFSITSSFNFFGTASYDMQTIHYDSSGAQQWISNYNFQSPQSNDYPVDIQSDAAYNTWVCGAADVGTTSDMACYKQNMYGTKLWTVSYNGTANGNDTAIAISSLPNNLTVVTGKSSELINGLTKNVITTMLIDSGNVIWTKHFYGDSLDAIPTAMVTDANGFIYISGYYQTGSSFNAVLLVYDQSGNLVYKDVYVAGANISAKFNDLITDDQGFIYVTGQSYTTSINSDYVTIKYAVPGISSISETQENLALQVYPNPAAFEVNIRGLNFQQGTLKIKDINGRIVFLADIMGDTDVFKLPIENFTPGIYLVEFVSAGNISLQKLVVK